MTQMVLATTLFLLGSSVRVSDVIASHPFASSTNWKGSENLEEGAPTKPIRCLSRDRFQEMHPAASEKLPFAAVGD